MFDVFDNMEVQSTSNDEEITEKGDPIKFKNFQMQPEAISYLVKNFFTLYRMSTTWRIKNNKYENPIENFIKSTESCL